MKKIVVISFFLTLGLFVLLVGFQSKNMAIAGDGCYICTSDSKDSSGERIHYCRYGSSDTFDQRKACKAAGCNVTGTASCPTAANYNVINP